MNKKVYIIDYLHGYLITTVQINSMEGSWWSVIKKKDFKDNGVYNTRIIAGNKGELR